MKLIANGQQPLVTDVHPRVPRRDEPAPGVHLGAKLLSVRRLELGAAIRVPLLDPSFGHVANVVGDERFERQEHFPGLGGFAEVDGNVLGGGVVEDVHLDVAERCGLGHSAAVTVDALAESRVLARWTSAMPVTTERATNAVNAGATVTRWGAEGRDVHAVDVPSGGEDAVRRKVCEAVVDQIPRQRQRLFESEAHAGVH
eukprot:276677-Prymnesium_polylepis.1